jgi:AcrR family transcriptional regulator
LLETSAESIGELDQAAEPQLRRMGAPGSLNWSLMLDAAEVILCEEGYAALTSRRVAEVVGVKQRLVYYYFHTMDALAASCFHRIVEREMERLEAAARSDRPVRAFWTIATETSDSRLIAEFMALANRNAALKADVIAFVEKSRSMQVIALTTALARHPDAATASPDALVILGSSLALALNREAVLGIGSGHGDAAKLVTEFLDRIEP